MLKSNKNTRLLSAVDSSSSSRKTQS